MRRRHGTVNVRPPYPTGEVGRTGTAPDVILATKRADGEIVRTRPVFSYPRVARYDGSGNIDAAENFVATMPTVLPDDRADWLGSFRPGNQAWCGWDEASLVCSPVRTSGDPER